MEKSKIPAVFKEDLQKLLESLNELEAVIAGERSCSICSNIISSDNIGMLIPRANNQFEYICNNSVCIEEHNFKKPL